MSVDDTGDWQDPNATIRGFVRSAAMLAGCILVVAAPLCLISIATQQPGSGGPWGVAAAACICLVAGVAADAFAAVVYRGVSPLASLLAGMAVRSAPPLAVCLMLAAQGGGRQHLAFVIYLLTFYLVSLALDTWWAVRRVASSCSHTKRLPI